MTKFTVATSRSEKEFSTYMGAVNYAISKDGLICADNGKTTIIVPTMMVGTKVMYKNYEVECIGLHKNTVDLAGNALEMSIKMMGVDPAECREIGSVESVSFYYEEMSKKLVEEKPTRRVCDTLVATFADQQSRLDTSTPQGAERNCRLVGFKMAVEHYIIDKL